MVTKNERVIPQSGGHDLQCKNFIRAQTAYVRVFIPLLNSEFTARITKHETYIFQKEQVVMQLARVMYIVLLRISNLYCYFVSFQIYFLCWIMYGMFALVASYERVELDYQKSRTLVMLLIEIMQKPSPVLGKINPLSLCLYGNDIFSFGWT